MSESNAPATKMPNSFQAFGVVLLVLGVVLTGMGLSGGMEALAGPVLYGVIFWSMITFGFLGLNLLFQVTRARWGTPILRIFEAGGGPVHIALAAGLLYIVVWWFFKEPIYGGWINMPESDQILQNKKFYLNELAFNVRSVLYFVGLFGIAYACKTWTRKEESTKEKRWFDLRNTYMGLMMVAFFVILTFLTTDYVMSIDGHWFSTIWGIWFVIGGALGAMALAVGIAVNQGDKSPYDGNIDSLMRNDFGNLLLMLTMLWGYFSFSQLLIIWSGNLKEFIPFYLARLRGNFSALGTSLFIGQFLVPFLMLLSPSAKRSKAILGFLCGMIFLFRAADMYWIVFPYFRTTVTPQLGDFGPLLAVGGIWMFLFAMNLKSAPLMTTAHPYRDANPVDELQEATQGV